MVNHSNRSSVTCPSCSQGLGKVEHTMDENPNWVRRSRCCDLCGHTWSTAEIPLPIANKWKSVYQAIRELKDKL